MIKRGKFVSIAYSRIYGLVALDEWGRLWKRIPKNENAASSAFRFQWKLLRKGDFV